MLTTPMKRMLLANRQASTIASLTNLRGKIPNGDNKVSMDFPVNRSNYPNYNYIKISYICYNNRNKSINCFNSFTKRFYTSDLSEANIQRELVLYSNKKQTPVSLQALMDTGKGNKLGDFASKSIESSRPLDKILMQVACFLHRELPVRLAHRAVKLEAFPLFARSGKFIG